MSGFFGIFNRNGKVVEEKTVKTMLDTMSYWAPDERDVWIDGSVALGHAMLWNTPESKYEHLPLHKNGYIMMMDARIDNREELAKELSLPNRPIEEIGDSEFILESYRKWGEECSKYLLGDFVFAIWDEKKEQLFCSRDYIGIKQFYYYKDDEVFVFSNDIEVLLAYGQIKNIINENAVACYLRYNFLIEHDSTFFENIHKLDAATNITIMVKKERKKIYWKAENCPQIRYKNFDEYTQVARNLLEKAVEARIRSAYPIASHLSGGLDSSSISVLASRKLVKRGHRLTGFNWIPVLDSDVDSNYYEWGNSKKIALLENIEHQAIELSEDDILEIYKTLDITHGDIMHFWYEYQIQKYTSIKGIRVILSGTGGDEFISNNGRAETVNLSWLGKFKKVHKSLISESLGSRELILKYMKRFYSSIVYRITPDWFSCAYNGTHCGFSRAFKYLQPSIVRLIKKLEIDDIFSKKHNVRDSMLDTINSGSMQVRADSWNRSGRLNKLEYRYPLLDKRLVEFALGIPQDLFHKNGINRYFFKRIVEPLLPEEITWFYTKYEPKRVENYMILTQKAQSKWRKLYVDGDKNSKYIKLDALFKEIDKLASKETFTLSDYNMIISITNAILVMESSVEKGKL